MKHIFPGAIFVSQLRNFYDFNNILTTMNKDVVVNFRIFPYSVRMREYKHRKTPNTELHSCNV